MRCYSGYNIHPTKILYLNEVLEVIQSLLPTEIQFAGDCFDAGVDYAESDENMPPEKLIDFKTFIKKYNQ